MKTLVQCTESGDVTMAYRPPSNPHGLISLGTQLSFSTHRCGWSYAIDSFIPEHNDDGILLDGFVDRTFNSGWNKTYAQELPRTKPWTGFVHNPPGYPHWFPDNPQPSFMFSQPAARKSMQHCVGLFTLTEYLAEYLRRELNVPASALIFATEIPDAIFDYKAFLANTQKQIVAVGWWLRRIMSIYYLPLDKQSPYRKVRLLNSSAPINSSIRTASRLEFVHDWRCRKLENQFRDNTADLAYLPNGAYDELLSQNIVFLDLFDASANNAVVECIARATPLLINRIPPVVEYLGVDYPFYFESLDEAAAKALDFDLVRRTHEYLLTCPVRARLSQATFLSEFRASEVYQQLRKVSQSERLVA